MSTTIIAGADSAADLFSPRATGSWWMLRTRARHEKIVANACAAKSVMHFLPLLTCARDYANHTCQVEVPLFPRWVFVRGSAKDAQADYDGYVAEVILVRDQDRVNEELKNIHLALRHSAELSEHPYVRQGVAVAVSSGPYSGLRGVIEDWNRRSQLILQVEVLGRGLGLDVNGAKLDSLG